MVSTSYAAFPAQVQSMHAEREESVEDQLSALRATMASEFADLRRRLDALSAK